VLVGLLALVAVAGFVSISAAQPVGLEGYQVLKVELRNDREVEEIIALDEASPEMEIWSDCLDVGVIDVRVSPDDAALLKELGFEYEVDVEDLQQLYDELFQGPPWDDFFDTYRSYNEHVAFMQGLVADYPNLASMADLGTSVQGRHLWAIRITGTGQNNPAVIYHGAQHGNEVIGPCAIAYTARHLLTNYATDPGIRFLVDNVEWFLLPMMNPDGYERGTRSNANGQDLNRDWPDPDGSPARCTQPETRAMRDFFSDHPNSRAHNDFHSYGRMIMWPWSYIRSRCQDDATYNLLGTEMQNRIRSIRGTNYDRGALCVDFRLCVNGSSVDYTYGGADQWGYGVEIGSSHHPPTREIVPTSQEMLQFMLTLTEFINDCNENGVPDWKDLAQGKARDGNGNRTPDECEYPACTFDERLRKAKCKEKRGINKLKVKLVGGIPGNAYEVELSSGEKQAGSLDINGKAKVNFKYLSPGPGTATATWECGAIAKKDYTCP